MIDRNVAEQSLIGCILMDAGKVMPETAAQLTADDFSLPDCRTIFAACRKLFTEQRPIDPVTVLHELGGEQEGYRVHLIKLVETTPSISHFREYTAIVAENARRSRAMQQTAALMELLESGGSLPACQDAAAQLAQGMSTAKGGSVSAAEGFELVAGALGKPRPYISTGFSSLDRYILFGRGDYLVIGGRPSAGKTAFSLQLALNMARGCNVCYFSLETSARKIYERLLSCFTQTPFDEINRGQVTEQGRLLSARERFSRLKLHVVDAAGWTVQQIRAKALQLRTEIIFVDYIGLIRGAGKGLYERVTGVSQDLHILAQQGGVAIVALSQLNRAGDSEPNMSNLRESGQIEQDADVVLLLTSPGKENQETPERNLRIAKNKTGHIGRLQLAFDGNLQRFTEICQSEDAGCRPF